MHVLVICEVPLNHEGHRTLSRYGASDTMLALPIGIPNATLLQTPVQAMGADKAGAQRGWATNTGVQQGWIGALFLISLLAPATSEP